MPGEQAKIVSACLKNSPTFGHSSNSIVCLLIVTYKQRYKRVLQVPDRCKRILQVIMPLTSTG